MHHRTQSATISVFQKKPIKVLVVDDDAASLSILVWAIAELGDNVRGCLNAAEALSLTSEFQPEVILLDLQMPHMDGLELCRALRANPITSNSKIIAQTFRDDREARRETAMAGFDLHLIKPLKFDTLADMFSLLREPQ